MDEAKKQIAGYAEVLFEGHKIPCAVGDDLYVYIPISGVCNILGIDTDAQVARIREHHALRQGLVKIDFPVQYGQKSRRMTEVNAISITRFHTWLATISVDRIENQEIREDLAKMQENLADVIYAFFGRKLVPRELLEEQEAPLSQPLKDFYEAVESARLTHEMAVTLRDRVVALEERFDGLEAAISPKIVEYITPQQQNQYQVMVNIIGDLLKKKGQGDIPYVQNELKRQFNFTSYKLIPAEDFDRIREYLIQWHKRLTPPGTPLPAVFTQPQQKRLL